MIKHRRALILAFPEDPESVVSRHQRPDGGKVHALLIVVDIRDVLRIVQSGMPEHIGIIRVAGEEDPVVKGHRQGAFFDALPVAGDGLGNRMDTLSWPSVAGAAGASLKITLPAA